MPDPSVSPADTIRRALGPRSRASDPVREAHFALDALLAVGERDKAEIERLRRLVARAAVKREVLLIDGERGRRQIAQLTEAANAVLAQARLESPQDWDGAWFIDADVLDALRAAVLVDEEDANGPS